LISQGMANKFVGQHPLRGRASRLGEGIMVIRFEMPYNVVCMKCNDYIARGVRFNAEKKSIGKYFSTKIWSFIMKCPTCPQEFEVQTDPKARDYVMVSGCRRNMQSANDEKGVVHDEDFGPEDLKQKKELTSETGTVALLSDNKIAAIRNDPFKRLEHLQEDQEFGDEEKIHLVSLQEMKDRLARDDYALNSMLRKKFREKKKEIKGMEKEGVQRGLSVPLLPYSEEDDNMAKSLLNLATTGEQEKEKVPVPVTSTTLRDLVPKPVAPAPTTTTTQSDAKQKQAVKASSIFGSTYSQPTDNTNKVKQQALQKCLQRGVDPRVFLMKKSGFSSSKITSFSATSPSPVDLKKKTTA